MSSETVILILGALLILFALLGSLAIKEGASGLIPIKARIPLGILGIFLVMYGGYSYGMVNPVANLEQVEVGNKRSVEFPVKKVQVLSPLEGDSVGCRILTMGVYPDSHEKDIWVLLKPSDNRYYPQSDHTNTSYKNNGDWQVITRFGGDKGESYEIIVYEADSEASASLSSTIVAWNHTRAYPGLDLADLPKGMNALDQITVSLQGNCRGVH